MIILLTCDPEIPVPPKDYGGIERIVDGLAKGYTNAGHQVYLIANPLSTCAYTITNFKWPALKSGGAANILRNMRYMYKIVALIKPDVIHSFSRLLYGYLLFPLRRYNFIQSYQRKISARSTAIGKKLAGKRLHFTACAAHMLNGLPNRANFTPIHNFTDIDYFDINSLVERTHLMFLGRIQDIKGPKEAIKAALQTNCDIIVAGNVPAGQQAWFNKEIMPFLNKVQVQYVGPIDDEQKRYYLQRAKALLFPIKWEEPFGIVMAEAMACGTPVIGFDRGSVPEVVDDNRNGYVVKNFTDMCTAIEKLSELSYDDVRATAVNKFSLKEITGQYLELMRSRFLQL